MATLVAVAGDPFAAPAQQAPSDPAMDASVMQTESGGDPTAVSPKGAKGRMQVMDDTAADPGFGVAPAADDSDDERERVGHDYLNAMLQRYGGNHALAAAAYNAGPGMADEWISTNGDPRSGNISDGEWANKIPYPETRDYVNRVMGGIASAPPPRLVAVDHDPFAAAAPQPRLVPVDHDPFAQSAQNPAQKPDSARPDFPDADQAFQDAVQPAINSDVGHAVLQTPTEMAGSVLKGIPVAARALGAAELPETQMATGAAPTPEDIQNADVRDTPFWRAGTGVQQVGHQAFPVSPEGDKSLSVQAARTVASIPAYIAAGAAGGPGAVATLAGLQSGGSGADEAAKLGGTPQQIGEAGSVDTIIGIATAAPVEAVLRPLLRAGPGVYQAAKTALMNAMRSGTIGASVSAAQQFAQNLVAQQTFDPNRPAGQGVGQAGAVGGLAFGAVGGVHGAMAPEGRVVDPNSTMQQPGRVDLSGGPGPIVDNGPAAHAEPPPLRTEGFPADTGAQPPPLYPGEPPPNAPAGSGGAIRALTGPTDARGEAFTPAPGQRIKVIYPDGSTAYGTFDGADQGKGETISFENSEQNPEAIRGKTLTGRASSYLILQPDDRAPAPPPPKPSLTDILDDSRSVKEIRQDAQQQARAASQPPGPASTAGTAENPLRVATAADLHAAVAEIDHAATPAQKEAGNYPKAHILWNDMPVTLETAQGRLRTAADGSWSVQMPAHYGYIRQTVGADTEQVDLYMGNAPQSGTVYVVDQIHPSDGSFDEHKILGGFPSQRQAVAAYSKAFSDGSGPSRIGAVTPMSIDQLKGWLANGDTTVPLAYVAAPPASAASSAGERSAAAPGLGTAPPSPGSAGTQLLHAVSRVVANREGGNLDPARMADVMGQPEPEIRRALDWLTGRGEGVRKGNDGRYTRTPQVGPLDLLQFIAANGGIRDHGGELVARNANRFIPGFGQLVRRHGKSFDDVTLSLWERGYLGPHHASAPRPEIGVMLDALDRALQGKRIYAEGEAQEVQQQHEARQVDQEQKERDEALAAVKAAIAEADLNLTAGEFDEAVRLVLAERYDPLEAVLDAAERGAIALEGQGEHHAKEAGDNEWTFHPVNIDAAERAGEAPSAPRERPTGTPGTPPAEPAPSGEQPGKDQPAPVAAAERQPEPEPEPAAEAGQRPERIAEKPPAAAPATERTAAGEQAVIPGAEKISDKALAERKMEGRAKPTVAQKPADDGLFDVSGRGQGDLLRDGEGLPAPLMAVGRAHGFTSPEFQKAAKEWEESAAALAGPDEGAAVSPTGEKNHEYSVPTELARQLAGESGLLPTQIGNEDEFHDAAASQGAPANKNRVGVVASQDGRIAKITAEENALRVELRKLDTFAASVTGSRTRNRVNEISDRLRALDRERADIGLASSRGDRDSLREDPADLAAQPVFFSALERGIEGGPGRAAPEAWRGFIRNLASKGVKQEEVEWSGINEWLGSQRGAISKADVLGFVRANEVQIKEVEKAQPSARARESDVQSRAQAMASEMGDAWESLGPNARQRYWSAAARELDRGGTKFAQHTLPGGENYRELLLTLPPRTDLRLPDGWRVEKVPGQDNYRVTDGSDVLGYGETAQYATQQALAENRVNPKAKEIFRGTHFDEPNVLAHVRFNDRTDADGKRVLFLEEVQSDWHQKGRKQGYGGSPADKAKIQELTRLDGELAQVQSGLTSERDPVTNRMLHEGAWHAAARQREQLVDQMNQIHDRERYGVPNAPLKTTWQEMAMKRMLRYAAEHGYDRLAWTTGAQQAERYDLSKHISRVEWTRAGTGGFDRLDQIESRHDGIPVFGTLTAWDHAGKEVISQHTDEIKLPDLIGKEAAEKLTGRPPKRAVRSGMAVSVRELKGLDLKVGGEGMAGFYDKILPAFISKYVKKWGATVGDAAITTDKPGEGRYTAEERGGQWRVVNEDDVVEDTFGSRAEAEMAAQEWNTAPATAKVHSVDITPEMRASVLQGQALFVDKEKPGGAPPPAETYTDETEEARKALGARRDHVALRKYVQTKGRDGFEHVVGFTKDGTLLDAGTSHGAEFVTLSPRMLQHLNTAGSDIDLRHNHPTDFSLSTADISVLGYRGAKRVVAYGSGGSTYEAMLTPKMAEALDRRHTANQPRLSEMRLIGKLARDTSAKVLVSALGKGRITADHGNFMHSHATNVAMAKAGVLDYKAQLADESRAEHPVFDEAVAAAQAQVERLLKHNRYFEGPNEVSDRPPGDLRAPDGLGDVPRQDENARSERPGRESVDRGGRGAPRPAGTQEGGQLEAPEPPLPERVREHGEGLKKSLQLGREFVQTAVKAFQLEAVPMAVGSDTARTIATDYANEDRLARARMSRLDQLLEKEFKPEERELMGRALEEQSVAALRGEEAAPKTGLARLNKKQRDAVEDLDKLSGFLWDRAIDVGLVQEGRERIPYYFPRMAVLLLTGGEIGRLAENRGEVGRAIEQLPANLRTTTANLKRRQYETAAETEAAIRAKFGDAAALVKDIRALPLALGRLERAIAGRNLVNQIKEVGRMVGTEWVSDNYQDGWFTIDHPSFRTARPRFKLDEATGKTIPVLDESGEIVFDRVPLHIHPDFRGPLLAIFTKPNGPIYRGLMALKSRAVMSIMYSPAIHNMVELGRAFPLMPGQFLKIRMMGGWLPLPVVHPYMVGYRARHDDEFMDYMISHGLVPMDRSRGHVQDITDVAEAPQLIPGRGLVGKGLRIGLSKINKEAALDAARAVDRFGDIWHKTLLWDRIADLQAGIAKFIMDEAIKDGLPKPVAARIASHIANRFAGALPQEAMSQFARKLFNIMLFSRTFTLGNLAAMKDAITGLPRNVQAQIKRDFAAMGGGGGGGEQPPAGGSASGAADKGPEGTLRRANNKARKFAARKALGAVITDILLYFILSSLVQNFFDWWNRNQSGWDIADGYMRRLRRLGRAALHNPFDVLNPITDLQALTPMSENEPGKQDRIYVGRGADGRGIYITNPIGRLGLEFISWLLEPLDMIRRKLSTLVRPVEQTVANDAGFGHQVYDPDASGFIGHLQQLGDVAWNFLKQQVPTQPFTALGNLMRDGTDKGLEAVKLLLPVLGISVSSGYPGGPAAGDLAHEKARQSQQIRAAYGDVAKMVEAGDTDKASERLEQLGMDPKEINATIKALQNPEARITSRKLDRFERSATPDEQERLDQHLDEGR